MGGMRQHTPLQTGFAICLAGIFSLAGAGEVGQRISQVRRKLPKPVQMDRGVTFERSARSGELILHRVKTNDCGPSTSDGASARATIRVQVNLVEIACHVYAPDGTAVRGLTESDFRIFENGKEQRLAHFDASSQGASIALVLDASPSVLPDSAAMKAAAQQLIAHLSPADEVAVVDFSEHTYLLLPFSRDRKLLEKAISGIDTRKLFADTGGSNIYRSIYLAAQELFPGRTGRKAIVLLTDGQDSGLGLNLEDEGVAPRPGDPPNRATFEDVVRAVSAHGVEIYAISTQNRPRIMTPAWLGRHTSDSLITPADVALGIPAYTAFLAELVRRVGGRLYFLNETGGIAAAYRAIVQALSAQYTLGYYPLSPRKPGWRNVRVEVDAPSAHVVNRPAYYIPAAASLDSKNFVKPAGAQRQSAPARRNYE